MIEAVAERIPREMIAAHFHDTYGQSLANILAVMERGITVDTAVGGWWLPLRQGRLGSRRHRGRAHLLTTGTSTRRLAIAATGRFICEALGRQPASKGRNRR